jgi:hypothetical protein
MTRIESTSSPRSQTARQKRSTMTVVFPVPAPAETKTTPGSSIARSCSRFGASTVMARTSVRAHPAAAQTAERNRLSLKRRKRRRRS